jgi:hypothetical protein
MRVFVIILLMFLHINLFAPEHYFADERREQVFFNIINEFEKEQRAIRLMRAMSIVESGGDYSVRGESGEYGRYQFTRQTWSALCKEYYGEVKPMHAYHQEVVASRVVHELIDKGYSDAEIASIWNCGKPDWNGRIGVNRVGVKYDVPNHVMKVVKVLSLLEKEN